MIDRGRILTGALVAASVAALSAVPPAHAGHNPIIESSATGDAPTFVGSSAKPRPLTATEPPRHPAMAPNGLSNLHVDAYQTDRNTWLGPLGRDMTRTSTSQFADCASHTFDSRGRLVTICVGLEGPRLMLFEPDSLHELARMQLPPRQISPGGSVNPFTDFSGGGYFYLDHRDRAVIPTTTRHIFVVDVRERSFSKLRDHDLNRVLGSSDAIISALPDWSGLIWFASKQGVVGTLEPRSGRIRSLELGEPITNSFAVDEDGAIYLVSDRAMYRLRAGRGGRPREIWRRVYRNDGEQKPGQTQAGSGTTPSVTPRYVAITDNADPINVVVYRRDSGRTVCTAPVFEQGQSSTDNSLIVTDRSIVVENNYGYTGPSSTQGGASTVGGVERVDIERDGSCREVWHNDTPAPTSVPKLSESGGLVYVYAKEPRDDATDAWYLTAIDFRSGRTAYQRLAGEGLGYNNNYAPITLAPDGDAYVGVLGGLVRLADADGRGANRADRARCKKRRATIVGTGGDDVLRATPGRDVIAALNGDDRVRGRGGNDRICLGSGADWAGGGPGNDRVHGSRGRDDLRGGHGDDALWGGKHADELAGGPGADRLFGGPGRDDLDGGRGDDRVKGGPGRDSRR